MIIFTKMPTKEGWSYINCAVSKTSNPDYTFIFPPEFMLANEKYIIIRQVRTLWSRVDLPFDYTPNDMILQADFVEHRYCGYEDTTNAFKLNNHSFGFVCICNDANTKKKKFKYVFHDNKFHYVFTLLDTKTPIIPLDYIIDFLLVFK
jgi:hypothetical protein